ncbi:HD domain-containing phosphohydrolase [Aquipuribacter sp. MA13-6]|uniref:HD-GYP domain-containing protein n=1 Tax=Aquipuribacter sp. MA13-6 TaxID=3440839 RepID=UPI003EEF17D5
MSPTPTPTPTRTDPTDDGRWSSRPALAVLLRLAILLAPVAVSLVVGLAASRTLAGASLWLLVPVLAVACLTAALGTERLVRRWLPLEALLRMTMLFPGRAPSRLAVARLGRNRDELTRRLLAPQGAEDMAHLMLALVTSLGDHDKRSRGHSERVRMLIELLADHVSLTPGDRDRLRWAALLHDIGKLDVASSVLSKPGPLNDAEWDQVRRHPVHGARIAGPFADWLGEWAGGILHHHERWDGGGYPAGLAGEQISRAGRLVAVVDTFETMTAARSYKKAGGTKAALAELTRCAGSQFDPAAVRAFLNIPLPRLWWATGPLGLLVQVPVIGSAQQSAVQLTAGAVSTAGTSAAAAGTAAVLGLGSAIGVTAPAQPLTTAAHLQVEPAGTSIPRDAPAPSGDVLGVGGPWAPGGGPQPGPWSVPGVTQADGAPVAPSPQGPSTDPVNGDAAATDDEPRPTAPTSSAGAGSAAGTPAGTARTGGGDAHEEPTRPDETAEPAPGGNPDTVGTPASPGKAPASPGKPAAPGKPDTPGKPASPGKAPAAPGKPAAPGEAPAAPGKPAAPGEAPAAPGKPAAPGEAPAAPGKPAAPGEAPAAPGKPAAPGEAPAAPGKPAAPGEAPAAPGKPAAPGEAPAAPGKPAAPGEAPAAPGKPAAPGEAPAAPDEPASPAQAPPSPGKAPAAPDEPASPEGPAAPGTDAAAPQESGDAGKPPAAGTADGAPGEVSG